MILDRRNFLKTAAVGTAAVAAGAVGLSSCTPAPPKCTSKAKLKISFQEGVPPGSNLNERLDWMEEHGVVGLEPGGGGLRRRVPELREALSGRDVKISAIVAGFQGWVIAEDEGERERFVNSMQEIIIAAGELESTGVIFVPAFNHQRPTMPHTMATRNYMQEVIGRLGDFAQTHGTTVIYEPLNRRETFVLRQVADSAAMCQELNNPGVTCMGDFWHMTWEEPCDYAAFISAGKYLQHVHIASRAHRNMPGEDGEHDCYRDGFRGLKVLDYDKYISFECWPSQGADRPTVVSAALDLIRKQWDEVIV